MKNTLVQGIVSVVARVFLSGIFLLSAVGNKIPNFSGTASMMETKGVPLPQVALAGAIAFLVLGSLSLIAGFKARIGAALLLVFLVLATYYFHDFWSYTGDAARQQQIAFMKNLALGGAMLFIMANGPGPMSVDAYLSPKGWFSWLKK